MLCLLLKTAVACLSTRPGGSSDRLSLLLHIATTTTLCTGLLPSEYTKKAKVTYKVLLWFQTRQVYYFLHRDLKCENILLDDRGLVKLTGEKSLSNL